MVKFGIFLKQMINIFIMDSPKVLLMDQAFICVLQFFINIDDSSPIESFYSGWNVNNNKLG